MFLGLVRCFLLIARAALEISCKKTIGMYRTNMDVSQCMVSVAGEMCRIH